MTAKEIKNYVDVMEHTLRRRMDSQAGKEELIKKYTEKMEEGLNALEELEAIKSKAQAQEQELRELKEKVSNFKNYTSLIDFLNIMKIYEWTNESDIIFEVGFGDGKETKEMTAEELRKDYADYNVLDYDLYHEVTDDNYILKGWIEIESFENLCKGSEE